MRPVRPTAHGGSSPRTRGTRGFLLANAFCNRFIPAYAGNTVSLTGFSGGFSVHPRVRGEHNLTGYTLCAHSGSSPRTRGTRPDRLTQRRGRRFIPAYAGNTDIPPPGPWNTPVHPRVRGEHFPPVLDVTTICGSSPRTRGTHGAGKGEGIAIRFIPAYAGNTLRADRPAIDTSVHPRVRGEHVPVSAQATHLDGSSPRTRGTHAGCACFPALERFIPAYAGNTGRHPARNRLCSVHPRVRGEHMSFTITSVALTGSSPRTRGTHAENSSFKAVFRFIPAYAGNTPIADIIQYRRAVHPRVRGEHPPPKISCAGIYGSSPRTRGTLYQAETKVADQRFIPAYAGNTAMRGNLSNRAAVHPRVRGEHYPWRPRT